MAPSPIDPGSARASQSKGRKFHTQGRTGEREWFCRSCATTEISTEMPVGWYRLDRKFAYIQGQVGSESPFVRLGLYCSIACFEKQIPRLEGIEAEVDSGEVDPREFDEMRRRR